MFSGVDSTSIVKHKALLHIAIIISAIFMSIPYLIGSQRILIILALVVAIIVFIRAKDLKESLQLGLVWGLVFFALQSLWIVALSKYAGVWAYVGWLALTIVEALFIAPFAIAVKVIHRKNNSLLITAFLTATVFTSLEILRSTNFLAYPWGLVANAFAGAEWFAGLAAITGWPGLTFIVVFLSAITALLYISRRASGKQNIIVGFFVVLSILFIGWGQESLMREGSGPKVAKSSSTINQKGTDRSGQALTKISLLQTNISMKSKWDQKITESRLSELKELLLKVPKDTKIVVAPETSLPGVFPENRALFQELAKLTKAKFFIGSLRSARGQIYNSVINEAKYQDKNKLVLFGEYIPFKYFANLIKPLRSSLKAGDKQKLLSKAAVLICSESADWLYARELTAKGANVIIVSTNDAWFKGTSLPSQHFQATRLRAIENGRYVLMAANYGYSGVIDSSGRIVIKSRLGKNMLINGVINLRYKRTFFNKYSAILMFAYTTIALACLTWLIFFRRVA